MAAMANNMNPSGKTGHTTASNKTCALSAITQNRLNRRLRHLGL